MQLGAVLVGDVDPAGAAHVVDADDASGVGVAVRRVVDRAAAELWIKSSLVIIIILTCKGGKEVGVKPEPGDDTPVLRITSIKKITHCNENANLCFFVYFLFMFSLLFISI